MWNGEGEVGIIGCIYQKKVWGSEGVKVWGGEGIKVKDVEWGGWGGNHRLYLSEKGMRGWGCEGVKGWGGEGLPSPHPALLIPTQCPSTLHSTCPPPTPHPLPLTFHTAHIHSPTTSNLPLQPMIPTSPSHCPFYILDVESVRISWDFLSLTKFL